MEANNPFQQNCKYSLCDTSIENVDSIPTVVSDNCNSIVNTPTVDISNLCDDQSNLQNEKQEFCHKNNDDVIIETSSSDSSLSGDFSHDNTNNFNFSYQTNSTTLSLQHSDSKSKQGDTDENINFHNIVDNIQICTSATPANGFREDTEGNVSLTLELSQPVSPESFPHLPSRQGICRDNSFVLDNMADSLEDIQENITHIDTVDSNVTKQFSFDTQIDNVQDFLEKPDFHEQDTVPIAIATAPSDTLQCFNPLRNDFDSDNINTCALPPNTQSVSQGSERSFLNSVTDHTIAASTTNLRYSAKLSSSDSNCLPSSIASITCTMPANSLYISGLIQGQPSTMLVDTGAGISAVSHTFYTTFPTPPTLSPSPTPTICTVSGEHLPVMGLITLDIEINGTKYPFSLSVINNLTYSVVLGRDFLMHYQSILNVQNNSIQFADNPPIPLNVSDSPPDASLPLPDSLTVHAYATYVLPPQSESLIPVYTKIQLPPGTTGLIEPNPNLPNRYQVCGASQLVSLSHDHTYPFRILNPTNAPITIYRCSTMGTFTRAAGSLCAITTDDVKTPSPSTLSEDTNKVPLDLSDTPLTESEKTRLTTLINEYRDIFALSPTELGRTGLVKHCIDTGDHPPIKQRPYRVSATQRTLIEEHVFDMLTRGIIQPSTSPWASPVILVKKKDGTDRFVVDYRRLNSVTRKDSYPLPRIDDALDALNGSQLYSLMDLMSGYWQVEMHPASREHTAFTTYGGLYEFLVTPFGLTSAPPTFMRLMECVLRNLTYKICLIYLDDILVYSRTFDDHLFHLRQVFDRLGQANLKLKPSKCHFACAKVQYLGHIVSGDGVAPDPEKISAVKNFLRPHNVKTVRSFLGLANYYRRFIKDFAKLAAPLNKLLRKDQKFAWTPLCEEAFEALKSSLTSTPILAFPDFTQPFHLFVDASNDGVGATLGQIQDGKEVAISYAGRDFNSAERNYSTTEREALAVIFGIKKFAPYIHGRHFILHTDHHSLKWLMNIADPVGRLARWSLLIQQHDFEIRHRPGANHANADALSRRSYKLPSITVSANDIPGVQTTRIHDLQRRDPDLADMIAYLESYKLPHNDQQARSLLLTIDDYFLDEDGLLYHLWTPTRPKHKTIYQQLVIPTALRYEILTWGHDDPTSAHFGTTKTYEKLRKRYYWRNMFSDIKHWCKSCCDCAMRKTPRNRHKAPLLPIPVQDAFDRLACDVLGPFPVSKSGNRYVVVFSEYLTKWVEAFPVSSFEAATIARLLVDEIFTRHGAPRTLLSDRGSNFLSSLVKEVCRLLNTKKLNTTAYHPQTDGQVERFNNTLAESISMYVSSDQTNWDVYIPSILFAYRVSPSVSTGDSPF